MGDTKTSMAAQQPPPKETVEMAPPPAWAIAMSEKMDNGFRAMRADLQLVDNGVTALKERVGSLESWRLESDARATANSIKVTRTSENDVSQDAAIASLVVDMKALKESQAAQTMMLTEAKDAAAKLWAKPQVRAAVNALWVAFVYWLGTKGIKVLP